jgi:hypothetical protein
MEFDPSHLQLVFNVIAITGLTSLALICSILKRDNEKLRGELGRRAPDTRGSQPVPPASATSVCTITRKGVPANSDQDIRRYVSRRMHDWIKVQAAGTET